MDYHVIIAKYKEDISWLEEMDKSHIYLYDKGFTPISSQLMQRIHIHRPNTENNSIKGFAHYEQRPNIGRESETYLYHIIKHYDNLPDFLILLQGNPFHHFKTEEKIQSINLQQLIERSINNKLIETSPMFARYAIEANYTWPGLKVPEYYSYIFQGSIEFSRFSPGCQYYLHKSKILSKPKAFWEKIHKMLVNEILYNGVKVSILYVHKEDIPFYKNGMNPWTFERLAGYLFNDTPINPSFLED